eukprot:1186914-Pyramimonas_sp.AAC.1
MFRQISGARTAHEGCKTGPVWRQMAPRRPEEAPSAAQGSPRGPRRTPGPPTRPPRYPRCPE